MYRATASRSRAATTARPSRLATRNPQRQRGRSQRPPPTRPVLVFVPVVHDMKATAHGMHRSSPSLQATTAPAIAGGLASPMASRRERPDPSQTSRSPPPVSRHGRLAPAGDRAGVAAEIQFHGQQDAYRCRPPRGDAGRGPARQSRRGIRLRVRQPQAASRQYLSSQGHPGRAVAAGGVRRLRRQPPRLPRLLRNPSRLLPDPGRRPAGADRGRRSARSPRPRRAHAERERGGRGRAADGRRDAEAMPPAAGEVAVGQRSGGRGRPRSTASSISASRDGGGRSRHDAETGDATPARPRRRQRRRSDADGADGRDADADDGDRRRQRRQRRIGRRRGRAGGSAGAPQAARPPVQDPGSHQAPPGAARPGRQGRARQQGRGADHLPLARRPLFGADAEHRARRRHLAARSPRSPTASA